MSFMLLTVCIISVKKCRKDWACVRQITHHKNTDEQLIFECERDYTFMFLLYTFRNVYNPIQKYESNIMRNIKQYLGIGESKLNYLNVFLSEIRSINQIKLEKKIH